MKGCLPICGYGLAPGRYYVIRTSLGRKLIRVLAVNDDSARIQKLRAVSGTWTQPQTESLSCLEQLKCRPPETGDRDLLRIAAKALAKEAA